MMNIGNTIKYENLPDTDDVRKVLLYLDALFGLHHIYGKYHPCRRGLFINATCPNSLATYDFDIMTKAVILSHKMKVRFEIKPSGPQMLQLVVFVDEDHRDIDQLKKMCDKAHHP